MSLNGSICKRADFLNIFEPNLTMCGGPACCLTRQINIFSSSLGRPQLTLQFDQFVDLTIIFYHIIWSQENFVFKIWVNFSNCKQASFGQCVPYVWFMIHIWVDMSHCETGTWSRDIHHGHGAQCGQSNYEFALWSRDHLSFYYTVVYASAL